MTLASRQATTCLLAICACSTMIDGGTATFSPIDDMSAREGLTLHATLRQVEGSDAIVLLVHGLGGSARDLRDVADSLHATGYTTLALDLRGHGRSGGTFPVATPAGYGVAANDVRGALGWIRSHVDTATARIVMMGISLGGGAVIANALENPDIPFVAWYPGLTYLHQGDSLVLARRPTIHGFIIQGDADMNPRANPRWTARFLEGQPNVGVHWIPGGTHGAGRDHKLYEQLTLDSIRAWVRDS